MIKNLTLERAYELYKKDYWDKCDCDSLEESMAICVFDAAVNCGVLRANKWKEDSSYVVSSFQHLRYRHYIDLVNKRPTLAKYLKGWLNRLNNLNILVGESHGEWVS